MIRTLRREWLLVALLVISVIINYADRANLSMAAPLLAKQLRLSPVQVGSLLSAFFWTYAFTQILGIAGWVADRFPVGLVFAAGFFAWSLATIATGFVSGFALIYAARLVLGAGESVAYPCYSKIFATYLPEEHRGRANAWLDAGTKVGPAIGTFLGGLLIVGLGWRLFFIVLGAVSLLWLIPWLKFMPRGRVERKINTRVGPSLRELLAVRSAWGTFLGHFCGNYFFYFLLTWIPIYLVKERGFSIARMANITTALFLAVAATTVATGWLSDRLIARGFSPTVVRKSVVVAGLAAASILLPFTLVHGARTAVVFLILASMGYGAYASNHWAISQTLAGPRMAGRWTSVQNGIGNLSGIAGPWLAGLIVQQNGSSRAAFILGAAVTAAGALLWGAVVGRVEPVRWTEKIPVQIEDTAHL